MLLNVLSAMSHTFGFSWGGNEPSFPAVNNSLAYADKFYTVTVSPSFTSGSVANLFDRRAITDARWSTEITYPATIEIDFGGTVYYWTTIGVFFNWDISYAPGYVKIEYYNTQDSAWHTLKEVSGNTSLNVVWVGSQSYVGKLRFTFDDPGTNGIAIGMIYGFTPAIYRHYFLWKEGDIMYGDLTILDGKKLKWSDVNLYRSAEDVLKTDDNFDTLALRIGGTEVISAARILRNVTPQISFIQNTSGNTVLEFG